MAKYRRYIVSHGETMQSIAQKELGDMNEWLTLIEFNDLKYPYIVDTVEEKMKNLNHLVTYGDTIIIPITEDNQEDIIRNLTDSEKEDIYSLALGRDLALFNDENNLASSDEVLVLRANNKGDVATNSGIKNLTNALLRKLTTPRGSYTGHPEYGTDVHNYIGMKNTEENAQLVALEIERTIRTDGRVDSVTQNYLRIFRNHIEVSFTITPMGVEESFEFVLSTENGIVTLI